MARGQLISQELHQKSPGADFREQDRYMNSLNQEDSTFPGKQAAYLLPANGVDRTSGYGHCQPAGASLGVLDGKQVGPDSIHLVP